MKKNYLDFLATAGIGGAHPGGLRLTKSVLAAENLSEKDIVLDVGCGTGQTAAYLSTVYGCDVTACDLNPTMIQKAKKRFAEMELPVRATLGNAEKLPFADQSFTYVFSESVTSFADSKKSLAEYKRVLAEDGRMIAIEMTRELPMYPVEITEIKEFYGIRSLLTKEEWIREFECAGFTNIHTFQTALVAEHVDDLESGTEFDLFDVSQLHPSYVDVYLKHVDLTGKYGSKLGYSVFICS